MRKASLLTILCLTGYCSFTQPPAAREINQLTANNQALAPLLFLASDELMGRATTRPEIHIAARYIGEQFRSFGLKQMTGTKDYFQNFELHVISAPTAGSFVAGNKTYSIGKDLLQARGSGIQLTAPVVFAGFGSAADFADLDVKGKIVVVNMGESDSTKVIGASRFRDAKQKLLKQKGAIAMVERYWQSDSDWELPKQYYNSQRIRDSLDTLLPVFIVHDPGTDFATAINRATSATLNTLGNAVVTVPAKNVIGYLEGTDPQLKSQYVVLSAHYDHIGVAPAPKIEDGKMDSIYNGTRDNAIGITAIINAARYFAQHPAKRSIVFIGFTGEEMGLLGSKYYVEHPTIGLEKVVYNLNIDNGGYNDTSRVNVIGLGRTSADEDMKKACGAYGLNLMGDPAPELNLFDRSDNVSFAARGVPAPTFGMGIKKVDESIMRRYHQLSDEVGNIDLDYTVKYIRCFILAAKYIADNPAQPDWIKGDKYEAVSKRLYSKPF